MSLMGADPSQDRLHAFETSWLFSPFVLGCIRALLSLYSFTTIFFIFGWQGTHGQSVNSRRSFSYFTNLSYWGIAFYLLVAAIHSFVYSRTGRSLFFEKTPRFLRALHSLLYTTVVVFPFVVTIVYWALLFNGTWFPDVFNAWSNVCIRHSLSREEITFKPMLIRSWTFIDFSACDAIGVCPFRAHFPGHTASSAPPLAFPLPPATPISFSGISHPRDTGVLYILFP